MVCKVFVTERDVLGRFLFFISTDIAFWGENNVIPTTDLFRLEVMKTDVCVSLFVQESITSWFEQGC